MKDMPSPESSLLRPGDEAGSEPRPGLELGLLRQALENVPEAFVTIDVQHRVVFFNAAAERLFGYARSEVLGKDLNTILAPDCSRDHRRAVGRYLETGAGRRIGHATDLVATRRDGSKVPISASFSVSRQEDRVYLTGIIRDMTEALEIQERLARNETLATLGRFTAEISHEIRNPLMIIGLNIHQLLGRAGGKENAAQLRTVEAEVKRLEAFLTELNEYYRPRRPDLLPLDAMDVLRDVCALARAECKLRDIQLDCRIGPGTALIRGDQNGLKEVLINLVQNAVEAMDRGGRLTLESVLGNELEIRIGDTGPGIPPDLQDMVFTPFFTTKSRGAGLGLAISKRIIDSHPGARIDFESPASGGTVFKILLPLASREGTP